MAATAAKTAARPLLVDIHTHVYTPSLVQLLRNRSKNPRIHGAPGNERLAILPDEVDGGRPVGPQYWNRNAKLSFMDRHRIDVSVISIANPWLDFLSPEEAIEAARVANEELQGWCQDSGSTSSNPSTVFSAGDARSTFEPAVAPSHRIRSFGILPFSEGVATRDLVASLSTIAKSTHLCGAIIGTRGKGKGLDDPELEPVWEAAEKYGKPLFLHPHYGIGSESIKEEGVFGSRDNGHVLPLALGFPFETASAASRLILAGVFDRYPNLRIILAHSGGALPALSSRLSSCVIHDPHVATRLQHDVRFYLAKFYYDAVCYGSEELEFTAKVIGRAHRFKRGGTGMARAAAGGGGASEDDANEAVELKRGAGRLLWGTDHPFFPPLASETQESSMEQQPWQSVTENLTAINLVRAFGRQERANIMGETASSLFGIQRGVKGE